MSLLDRTRAALGPRLVPISNPHSRFFWGYLVLYVLVAGGIFLRQGSGARSATFRGFVAFCFPKRIYLHASLRMDAAVYLLNVVFGLAVLPLLEPPMRGLEEVLARAGSCVLGPPSLSSTPVTLTLHAVVFVLVVDFALFLSHWLSHRVPWLWEFHKIHHVAPVLNPLTANRFHWADVVLFELCVGGGKALVSGVARFVFIPTALAAQNRVAITAELWCFVTFALLGNFRHSHLWVSYPPALSHVLCSPAMHQLHHSRAPRHIDRNFSYLFSFWDRLFGTLYVPRGKEVFEIGLNESDGPERYSSTWRLIWLPFAKLWSKALAGGGVHSSDGHRGTGA